MVFDGQLFRANFSLPFTFLRAPAKTFSMVPITQVRD